MVKGIKKTVSVTYIPKNTIAETITLAKMAEKYGLDYFWVHDEVPSYPFRDPFVTATTIANATRKIGLGLVSNPYSRHPSLTAAALLTIAETPKRETAFCYVPGGSLSLTPLAQKMWDQPLVRVRESTMILRRLLTGEKVEFDGETVRLLGTKMFTSRSIPIYLGARGTQMLRLAGELGDGVVILTPPGYFEYALELVAEGAEKSGRTIEDLEIGGSTHFYVSRNPDEARDSAKRPLTWIIPDCPDVLLKKIGVSRSHARRISHVRKTDGVKGATKLITDDMVDAMTISGNPDQCAQGVVRNFHRGVTHFMFYPPWGETERIGLRLIGEEVIPKVRAMMS